jgi:predicted DNA-binding transcriptional regulator AlpA
MRRDQAANYLALSPTAFDDWVSRGRLPGPIPGTKRWDRRAIDNAMDRLSGLTSGPVDEDDEFKTWLRENGHAS